MKKIFILLVAIILVLIPTSLLAQNTSQLNAGQVGPTSERARLFKTYTDYLSTSDDTTGFVTINVPAWTSDPLLCSEVVLLALATDSVNADVNVIGRNGTLTSVTNTYVDSITIASNTGGTKAIVLRNNATERFTSAETQIKVGTVFRNAASDLGTTTGRTLKWYIMYVFP